MFFFLLSVFKWEQRVNLKNRGTYCAMAYSMTLILYYEKNGVALIFARMQKYMIMILIDMDGGFFWTGSLIYMRSKKLSCSLIQQKFSNWCFPSFFLNCWKTFSPFISCSSILMTILSLYYWDFPWSSPWFNWFKLHGVLYIQHRLKASTYGSIQIIIQDSDCWGKYLAEIAVMML